MAWVMNWEMCTSSLRKARKNFHNWINVTARHGEKIIYLGDFNYDVKSISFTNYTAVLESQEHTNTLKYECYDNFLVSGDVRAKITQRNVAEIQCVSPVVKNNTTFFAPTKDFKENMVHTIYISDLSPQLVSDHCPIYIDLKIKWLRVSNCILCVALWAQYLVSYSDQVVLFNLIVC